jgi:hypothetical protein
MKIVRFASASDGGSQFIEIDIPINNAATDAFGNTVHRSAVLPAQSTMVTDMPDGLYQDWHPASRRQLLFVLSGTLEVETSDGKKHRCSSGEVFLADDVGSRGHRTRTIGGPTRVLFVHLPPTPISTADRDDLFDIPIFWGSQGLLSARLLSCGAFRPRSLSDQRPAGQPA